MLGKTGAENASQFRIDKCIFKSNNCQKVMVAMLGKASQFRIDKCRSNQIFIKKLWLGMIGKAGAEKRPSQSLALHCSDRCAVEKEKDKDKCTIYRGKKVNTKTGIHYAETKRRIQKQVYTHTP